MNDSGWKRVEVVPDDDVVEDDVDDGVEDDDMLVAVVDNEAEDLSAVEESSAKKFTHAQNE